MSSSVGNYMIGKDIKEINHDMQMLYINKMTPSRLNSNIPSFFPYMNMKLTPPNSHQNVMKPTTKTKPPPKRVQSSLQKMLFQ